MLMSPGKMRHYDSASHLALNLEMTQEKKVVGREGGTTHYCQENYRDPRSMESPLNFGASIEHAGPSSRRNHKHFQVHSVRVPFSETFIEQLCQVLGLQGTYTIVPAVLDCAGWWGPR